MRCGIISDVHSNLEALEAVVADAKDQGVEKFFCVGVYIPNSGATLKWQDYRVDEWDLDFRCYLKGLE